MRKIASETSQHLFRWAATLLVVWLLTIAATGERSGPTAASTCTGQPSPVSGPTQVLSADNHLYTTLTATKQVPQVTRFWRPGIFVVAVVPTCGNFQQISEKTEQKLFADVSAKVQNILKTLLKTKQQVSLTPPQNGEDDENNENEAAEAHLPSQILLNTTATFFFTLNLGGNLSGDSNLQKAVNAINNSNIVAKQIPINIDKTLTVVINSASPDWLSGGAGGGFVGGHPGGSPGDTPVRPIAAVSTSTSCTAGSGPTVYVLDTAHALSAGGHANVTSQLNTISIPAANQPSAPPGSPGCNAFRDVADVTQEMDLALPDLNDFAMKIKNPYSVSTAEFQEHGLFVSTLIHHIAPSANIHLIRVLNDYGVGDLQSLLNGLKQIFAEHTQGAIVNMSLGVVPPPQCLPSIWADLPTWESRYGGTIFQKQPLPNFIACEHADPRTFLDNPNTSRLYNPLGLAIHELTSDTHDLLVAAAGNDSANFIQEFPITFGAELPAAFCDVIAVGAAYRPVGSKWPYSSTSLLANFSNVPYFEGRNCLKINLASGNMVEQPGQADHAVLAVGMKICSLLLHPQDFSSTGLGSAGFALWQGTSFSTAIISGNLVKFGGKLPGTPSEPGNLDENQPCFKLQGPQ